MLGQQEEVCDDQKDEVLRQQTFRTFNEAQKCLKKDARDIRAEDEALGGLYLIGVGSVVMESTCTVAMVAVISQGSSFQRKIQNFGHIPKKSYVT